jgi:hypothetical protein
VSVKVKVKVSLCCVAVGASCLRGGLEGINLNASLSLPSTLHPLLSLPLSLPSLSPPPRPPPSRLASTLSHYIDKKCPFTGNVSIRGRILTGTVKSTKMNRTIIVRRDYLHYIKKYMR